MSEREVEFSEELFSPIHFSQLNCEAYGAFVLIISYIAHSMTPSIYGPAPTDGWVDFGDLHNVAKFHGRPHAFRNMYYDCLASYFHEREDGKITPKESWFAIGRLRREGDLRPPIPASVRSEVMQRDKFICTYCGTKQGPFDLDHVVPYSRGGAHTDPENLVCACGPCNRSKRAMTPGEWISGEVSPP